MADRGHDFGLGGPPWQLFVVALCVLVPKQIQDIGEMMGAHIFARVSEVQEFYMFYFVLLYLIAIKARIKEDKSAHTYSGSGL